MNTLSRLRRGFTLIELLVVIAIIGILAAVVLASLNSARAKGEDAAVKSNLSSIRTQAELYFNSNGNYGSQTGSASCIGKVATSMFIDATGDGDGDSDGPIEDAIIAARDAGGAGSGGAFCATGEAGGSYAIAARLKSKEAWHCIDSSGAAKEIAGASGPALGGPTGVARCP